MRTTLEEARAPYLRWKCPTPGGTVDLLFPARFSHGGHPQTPTSFPRELGSGMHVQRQGLTLIPLDREKLLLESPNDSMAFYWCDPATCPLTCLGLRFRIHG